MKPRVRIVGFLSAVILVQSAGILQADSFGSGSREFSIEFVTVNQADNPPDNTGYGAVAYDYRMEKYEVRRSMIGAYNALRFQHGGPELPLDDMTDYGGNGGDRPATGLNWIEAARFVNWLNTSKGFPPAYKIVRRGMFDVHELWKGDEPGFDASNPLRNQFSYYFLPSEDEWYKAAYYDPNLMVYWDFGTASDTMPTPVPNGTAAGTAVHRQSLSAGPADVNDAGGLSAYGTMAQYGNVSERLESVYMPPVTNGGQSRVGRDMYWGRFSSAPESSTRFEHGFGNGGFTLGFRVASLASPPTVPQLEPRVTKLPSGQVQATMTHHPPWVFSYITILCWEKNDGISDWVAVPGSESSHTIECDPGSPPAQLIRAVYSRP